MSQLHFLVSDKGAYQWQEKCHEHREYRNLLYCNTEFKKNNLCIALSVGSSPDGIGSSVLMFILL